MNFAVNQEKRVDRVLRKLVESKSMTEKIRKSLKPVGSRPGVMYGSCKVHKVSVENCPSFRPILSALNTLTYKLVKFLVRGRQIYLIAPDFSGAQLYLRARSGTQKADAQNQSAPSIEKQQKTLLFVL